MSDRLTLATATGLAFVTLAFHVVTGLVALAAGFTAILARKGGKVHGRSGLLFVYAMIATGITAAGISVHEGKGVGGGAYIIYFVLTAWTAVRPVPDGSRRMDAALMVLALSLAAAGYVRGFAALGRPGNQLDGVPAGMTFLMSTIALLAAAGDARMILRGGIHGAHRLARHLWRMCFALFIASGSFFIGQMKFIPEPIRLVPLLVALGVAPLPVLAYWMWRVRLKSHAGGTTVTPLTEAGGPA